MNGFDVPIIRVLSVALFGLWLVSALVRKQLSFPVHLVTLFLFSWLFFVLLSIGVAAQSDWAWRKFVFLLSFLPLFLVFSDTLRHSFGTVERVLKSFVVGAVVAAGIALIPWILQWILGIDPLITLLTKCIWPFFLGNSLSTMVAQYPSFLVNIGGHTLFRAVGLFPDPHIAAYFFEMAFPCALALAFTQPSGKRRIWFFSAGLLLTAIVLTFARGSYAGLAFAGLIGLCLLGFHIFSTKRISLRALLLLIIGMAIALGVLFFSPIGSRFLSSFSEADTSNQGRFAMWAKASEAIATRPWLGVGLGNFPLFVDPSTNYRTPIYAHNIFLDTLSESGICAGFFLLMMLTTAVGSLFLITRKQPLFFGPFFGLLIFLGHSFFENPLFSVHILPLLCLFLALSTIPADSHTL
jgi:O-antigen ligase